MSTRGRSVAAATVVYRARMRARMTQQQLADAAGTSRSAVSNIERGSRDPAWDTVVGLVEAAGFRLDPVLSDAPTAPEGGPPPTVE